MAGHFAKAGVQGGSIVREFRLNDAEVASLQVGGKVGVDIFQPGQIVDVSGMSIGKGFAGVIRRHHFSSNRATHGNSISHNRPGSTGQNQSPSKVFKGKRMAGHLGAKNRTVPNLEVVRVDTGRGLLLLKGSVPGAEGGHVVVKLAAKGQRKPAPAKAAPAAAKSGAKPAAKK
jgi:large subunit ribosomal protein L3